MSKRRRRRSTPQHGKNSAAEAAARLAAEQIAIAKDQRDIAEWASRRAKWAMIAAFLGVGAAISVPFAAFHYQTREEARRTYSQQIELEVALAMRMKATIESMREELAPGTGGDVGHILSVVGAQREILDEIEQSQKERELLQDRDKWLSDVYIARRELFFRLKRTLAGAVVQAEYERAQNDKTVRTVNYIGAILNVQMAYNRYIHLLADAAKAHGKSIPGDLWIISPDLTGPMMHDSN